MTEVVVDTPGLECSSAETGNHLDTTGEPNMELDKSSNCVNGELETSENVEEKLENHIPDGSSSEVSDESRKSSSEKHPEEKMDTSGASEEVDIDDDDTFVEHSTSTSSSGRVSVSSCASTDEDGVKKPRKASIYEQRQIDAPTSMKGSGITSRTQTLFRQYSKDLLGDDEETDHPRKKSASEIKQELQNVKSQYQERLAQEEQERAEERARRTSEADGKSRKTLGSHMNRYLALTKGEAVTRSSDEDEEDGVDESLYVDQHGVKIERSGGKVEILKSSEGISSIKNKFGGTAQWKKADTEATPALKEVDANSVNSARNLFRGGESKKTEQATFNRPVKKVHDPKSIMEMRKQVTYGGDEELPQDNTVQKTVVGEIDASTKHRALDVYKNLEKKQDADLQLQKPKTKLVSDLEARATMEGIRSISSSASEASDVNETANDLTVDTVSGYGSAAPCSPSSTLSEDYLSDHKEASPRDDLKDSSSIHCGLEGLSVNGRTDLENEKTDLENEKTGLENGVSPVNCQPEIPT